MWGGMAVGGVYIHLPKAFCAISSSMSTCAGEGVNHREGGTTTYCKAFGLGQVVGARRCRPRRRRDRRSPP